MKIKDREGYIKQLIISKLISIDEEYDPPIHFDGGNPSMRKSVYTYIKECSEVEFNEILPLVGTDHRFISPMFAAIATKSRKMNAVEQRNRLKRIRYKL
jgi:hypothetical protein